MKKSKFLYETSCRIDSYIKNIMEDTYHSVRKQVGKKITGGKISRTLWISIYENDALRKRCIDAVCRRILQDIFNKEMNKKV